MSERFFHQALLDRPSGRTEGAIHLKSGVFLGFVVYRKNRLASCGVIATPHCVVRNGWGPVVPGVCTVHRLVLTPTVTTLEPHAALCPTIKFLLVAEETGGLIRDL